MSDNRRERRQRTHLVDLRLGDDGRRHRAKDGEQTLGPVEQLLLLRSGDDVSNLVFDRAGDLVELVVGRLLAAFRLVLFGLAALEVAFDELEVDELLDGTVTGDEDKLRKVESVAGQRVLRPGGTVVLVHRVGRSILARLPHLIFNHLGIAINLLANLLLRLALILRLSARTKHPDRHLPQDLRAKRVGLVAEVVDCVDGLLGHTEPLLRRGRRLDRFGEASEDWAVHREADLGVVEGACASRREGKSGPFTVSRLEVDQAFEPRRTLDLLDAPSDPSERDACILGEHEVLLAVRSKSNLEERVDVVGDDFGFGLGEHAEHDDGAATLKLGDVLRGACERQG